MKVGVQEVATRVWFQQERGGWREGRERSGVHSVEIAPTERFKLRRQMAATAGKKSTTSLSLFLEAFGFDVEEELSTMATQIWAEGTWIGKWHTEQKKKLA